MFLLYSLLQKAVFRLLETKVQKKLLLRTLVPVAVIVGGLTLLGYAVFLFAEESSAPSIRGAFVTVKVGNESFAFFTTNQTTIEDAYRARDGTLLHPNGRLLSGREAYNPQWDWHYDPNDIQFDERSIELCDGKPSDVQDNLKYWLTVVGRFCPWIGKVSRISEELL